jgi:hypothetical protein
MLHRGLGRAPRGRRRRRPPTLPPGPRHQRPAGAVRHTTSIRVLANRVAACAFSVAPDGAITCRIVTFVRGHGRRPRPGQEHAQRDPAKRSLIYLSERKELNPRLQIFHIGSCCNEFKISKACSYCHLQLVCIDDATERNSFSLSRGSLREQVFILREQHPAQDRCAVQEFLVAELRGTIFSCREHVDLAQTQPDGNGSWYVLIHIEGNRHVRIDLWLSVWR